MKKDPQNTFRARMHRQIRKSVAKLQHHVDRWWYAPLIGVLAALDNFLVVIPNDGILISSSMLVPKRWFTFALFVAIGSAVGGTLLAGIVEYYGLAMVIHFYPGIEQSQSWLTTQTFFEQYGLLVVFAVAVTPLIQQPAVILASLANTPLFQIALVIFVGRWIKFMIMAYLGSHAPKLLSRLWGLEGELKDAGIDLSSRKNN